MTRAAPHRPALRRLNAALSRRGFTAGLTLGAAALLTGCDLSDDDSAIDRALWAMLRFNDRIQAAIFNPTRLARTYSRDQITSPYRFNAFYPIDRVPHVDPASYQLELSGRVSGKTRFTLADLAALPQTSQITRHICVEGWSQIGEWSGVKLSDVLLAAGADLRAPFVGFTCADDYYTSIDMASALHPQTILALTFGGAPLAPPWGAPLRLRIPTKLGFKNPKHIVGISVTSENPGGYWEDQGYNWFSGS